LNDREFLHRHGVFPIGKKLLYLIIPDREPKEPIVKAILRDYGLTAIAAAGSVGIASTVTGDDISKKIIIGTVVVATAAPLIVRSIKGFRDYKSDIQNPLKKYFDFNVRDFVGLTGCEKDLDFKTGEKRLIRKLADRWVPIEGMQYEGPSYGKQDYCEFRKITRALISNRLEEGDEELVPKHSYEEEYREYISKMLEKDVISVGGPISLDPLFDKMKGKDFPCNYDLIKEHKFFLDKVFKKYPLQVSEKYLGTHTRNEFEPEWNKTNFGLISKVEKKLVFDKGSGVFVNASGCNWQGTAGASSYFYEKEKLKILVKYIEDNKALDKNFQVVVETPLTEQGVPITDKTKLLDIFTW